MGSACCCLRDGFGAFLNQNNPFRWNFTCFHYLLQNISQVYASLFRREEVYALPLSTRGTASLSPTQDDPLADVYRSPPMPLPYDADPRYYRLKRNVFVSGQEKGSSRSYEETEPLRTSEADDEFESLIPENKGIMYLDKSYNNAKPSLKLPMADAITGFAHLYDSSDDEDVCPTCLEEYSAENPKIVAKCSHHFHLGCIYEWMERSDKCPVCGKVMVFNETS